MAKINSSYKPKFKPTGFLGSLDDEKYFATDILVEANRFDDGEEGEENNNKNFEDVLKEAHRTVRH